MLPAGLHSRRAQQLLCVYGYCFLQFYDAGMACALAEHLLLMNVVRHV
jgi:hypothetical protein